MINKTQLYIDKAEERGIIHRDYLAHCLRWTHVMKYSRINQTWLDIGCGTFPLAMTLYTNKLKPKLYVGVDVRKNLQIPKVNFPIEFKYGDIVDLKLTNTFDNIVCFEMLEHVEKFHAIKTLKKIASIADKKTNIFISTPNYDGKHQAANHIHECKFSDLKEKIEKYFVIENIYGTFASQSEIIPVLANDELKVFNKLKTYYDSNLLSIMLAPLHPIESRNCLWRLRIK